MTLALFVLITWLTICTFFLVPKSLTKEENVILFFIIDIIISNIYIVLNLNLKLVRYSYHYTAIISLFLHRNIIIPFCLLIFANLTFKYYKLSKRILIILFSVLFLVFIKLITIWDKLVNYTAWTFFFTTFIYVVLLAFAFVFIKALKKLP